MSLGNAPPLMRFLAAQGEQALALPYALTCERLDGAMGKLHTIAVAAVSNKEQP